jgi:hypothetical protein
VPPRLLARLSRIAHLPQPALPLLAAMAVLATGAGCAETRTASDETTCSTEADCARLYRVALANLNGCVGERLRAGYVGPGAPPPPQCDLLRAEAERWAAALNRIRGRKEQESNEEKGGGFEVPPLPGASAAPAAPPVSSAKR